MQPDFSHIETWVFDLDNTLYPPDMGLFPQIERRMTDWVMQNLHLGRAEADRLRATYWRKHGTTLAGLMREHSVDPAPYLRFVHDLDFTVLSPDPALAAALKNLPGRRIVYTNADAPYAHRVLDARGLSGVFDAVYGVEEADYHPKPDRKAFETIFAKDRLTPTSAAMFEDDAKNLLAPHAMGLSTIHVAAKPHRARHIQHHTADLTAFLTGISPRNPAPAP